MNRTILLADDSSTIRKIIELTFHDSQIRVETVAGGLEALEKVHAIQPDLLLADVIMPEPSGYELCRQVKQSPRPIPVILLTGAFEEFDADRARLCGADDRLVKPFESQMLRDTVERLLRASTVPAGVRQATLRPEDAQELDVSSAEVEESRPDEVPPELPVEASAGRRVDAALSRLSTADIDAVADAVVRRLSGDVVRELAREMLPEIATELVRQRIRELEGNDG